MKKILLTLVLTMVVMTASFHAQVKQWIGFEKKISKDVSFLISVESVYGSRVYANSAAKLHYTIIKVKGNESKILLDKEYPEMDLNKILVSAQTFNQTIHIPDVMDSREKILVTYTIIYKTKQSILKIEKEKLLAKGNAKEQMCITI